MINKKILELIDIYERGLLMDSEFAKMVKEEADKADAELVKKALERN